MTGKKCPLMRLLRCRVVQRLWTSRLCNPNWPHDGPFNCQLVEDSLKARKPQLDAQPPELRDVPC